MGRRRELTLHCALCIAEAKLTASRHCYFGSLHTSRLIKEIINEDNLQIIIGDGMFVSGKHIWATVCANSTGVAEDEHYDLSNIFNSTNNQPWQIVVLPEKSGWVGVSAICPPGTLVNYTYRSYVTNFIVQETIDNYKYMQLNDYLLGAMSLVDSVMDIQFPAKLYSDGNRS